MERKQQLSYSNRLIVFVLENYIDIDSGHAPLSKAADAGFLKSAGRQNPMETFLIWRSDVDKAISLLAGDNDRWADMVRDLSLEGIRTRIRELEPIQRQLVTIYIFNESYYTRDKSDCWGIIAKMRRSLNGEPDEPDGKPCKVKLNKYKKSIIGVECK